MATEKPEHIELGGFPWEETAFSPGLIKVFFSTCARVLLRPHEFFRRLSVGSKVDPRKRVVRALFFAAALGYIKLACDVGNLVLVGMLSKKALAPSVSLQLSSFSDALLTSPFFLARPLVTFGVTLVFLSLGVKLILGFDRPLAPVFLVASYKSAAELFYCIPFIGGVFAFGWTIMLLLVGLREVYRVPPTRAFLAGIVFPSLLFLFIFVSIGPVANKVILSLYPEARGQVMQLNEVGAYVSTSTIASACQEYKKDLGFFPSHLGVLDKRLSAMVFTDETGFTHSGGYAYEYTLRSDNEFTLTALPVVMGETGRFIFYTDQTGKVRLDNRHGQVVEDVSQLEGLIGRSQAPESVYEQF